MSRPIKATTANVTAGTASGAVVLIWIAGLFGLELDAVTAGAMVAVIAVIAGWLVPSGGGDHAA